MLLEQSSDLRCLRGIDGVAAGVDETVGIGVMFQQQFDHLPVATPRRDVQGGAALGRIGVGPRRVRAAFQEQADDVETAEFGGGGERATIVGTLLGDA